MSRSNTMRATVPFANANSSATSWRTLAVIVLCGAVLACGFFFAARQHFSSMELGIKNSQLRKQLSDLEAENRRLSLAREVASSPLSIRKASHLIAAPRSDTALSAEVATLKLAPAKPLTPDTEVRASLTKVDENKAAIASKVVKVVMVKPAEKVEKIPPKSAKSVKSLVEAKNRQKAL